MGRNEPFPDFFHVSAVDDAGFFVGELFRRKFGEPPPSEGHHFVAFVRNAQGSLHALGYTHFYPLGDIMLGGGACTDERLLRRLDAEQRKTIAEMGGVYYNTLKYATEQLHSKCEAFFGYCGDARAEAIDLRAGFIKTEHPHLIAKFHKSTHEIAKKALIEKVSKIGPF